MVVVLAAVVTTVNVLGVRAGPDAYPKDTLEARTTPPATKTPAKMPTANIFNLIIVPIPRVCS